MRDRWDHGTRALHRRFVVGTAHRSSAQLAANCVCTMTHDRNLAAPLSRCPAVPILKPSPSRAAACGEATPTLRAPRRPYIFRFTGRFLS